MVKRLTHRTLTPTFVGSIPTAPAHLFMFLHSLVRIQLAMLIAQNDTNHIKRDQNIMKNTKNYQIKNCITMSFSTYNKLIDKVTNGLKIAVYEYERGIYYINTLKAMETETYWNKNINETLSEYFDITVTSVHATDEENLSVWICYD